MLHGGPRAGKTQLALDFCHLAYSASHFRTVFWLTASSRESVSLGLESISNTVSRSKDGSQQDKIELANKFLIALWHSWLLVLDDYDYLALPDVLKYLPKSGCGAIILITREATAATLGRAIEVPTYLDKEGLKEMRRLLGQAVLADDAEKAEFCLDQGADVNFSVWVKGSEIPCLRAAVEVGCEMVLPVLLEYAAITQSVQSENLLY